MSNGAGPTDKPSLRIYRAEQDAPAKITNAQPSSPHRDSSRVSHDTAQLKHPQIITPEQLCAQVLNSISFSERVTRVVAPAQANLYDVVDALNTRWRTLTDREHLLSQQALKTLLMGSPAHLQRASGSHLVFEAALSEGRTEHKTFADQRRELKAQMLGVASPASTAVAMAALLVKAFEHGKSTFIDHLTLKSFRTQAVDPMAGHPLDHHRVVVKYDFKLGIVGSEQDLKTRSHNLWCAGSTETFGLRSPRPNFWGWIFGS